MHDERAGADRKDGARPGVAQTSATVVRRGIMFLAVAVSLFAID
jgi:hypothetical protein